MYRAVKLRAKSSQEQKSRSNRIRSDDYYIHQLIDWSIILIAAILAIYVIVKIFNEYVTTKQRILTSEEIKAWDWSYCETKIGTNRTEDLFYQLINIRDVFIEFNVSHILAYGSLIGAMRDHRMNEYEVDNDILMIDQMPHSNDIYQSLFDRGLILFHNGIWRVCKYSDERRKDASAPWGREYFPYTDIYGKSWYWQEEWNNFKDWNRKIVKKNFGDTFVFTPDEEFAEQWLNYWYDDWTAQPDWEKYGQGKV